MGLYLIAETAVGTGLFQWLWVILQVAVGLGMVIFVHELGHFLVAKACGVRCDKFFIGFDIGGYKISRRWGETEYGIGILPLGGYVKMLGQDDNPARAAEEMERARIRKQAASQEQNGADGAGQRDNPDIARTDPHATESAADSGENQAGAEGDYVLDPRSYLAKSVPQRMAIISAGVVMNVIFAFVLSVWAYQLGVKFNPCVVSQVIPGSPAWEANLRTGDEITQIGNVVKPRFRDLRAGVSLGDLENGIPIRVQRPDGSEQELQLTPVQTTGLPTIGILSPQTLRLLEQRPFHPDTPAARATPKLMGGDEIVAVGGQAVSDYRGLAAILARNPERALTLTVRRAADGGSSQPLEVEVQPMPMKRLGLMMKIGAITAVQADSPAADAGLKKDDFILQVDGAPVDDPSTLPEYLRRRAGETVVLTVERLDEAGKQIKRDLEIIPRQPDWLETTDVLGTPMSAPSIGIAYRILNRVAAVEPGSPAAAAGIRQGDEIVQAKFLLPDSPKQERRGRAPQTRIEFGQDKPNWPSFISNLQWAQTGTKAELVYKRGDETHTAQLEPVESSQWFNTERGFIFEPLEDMRTAETFGEALALGGRETKESLTMVFSFIRKLGTQIPFTALGGPVMIAQGAGLSAFDGLSTLLIFLAMLSANLAVINFLPIPLLDGGHMVFLIYEAIFRRPVSERIVIALHTIGFVFIISLMLFVLALDLGLIERNL